VEDGRFEPARSRVDRSCLAIVRAPPRGDARVGDDERLLEPGIAGQQAECSSLALQLGVMQAIERSLPLVKRVAVRAFLC
jgi:hypothetical protein